jgi:hypothetical protein
MHAYVQWARQPNDPNDWRQEKYLGQPNKSKNGKEHERLARRSPSDRNPTSADATAGTFQSPAPYAINSRRPPLPISQSSPKPQKP